MITLRQIISFTAAACLLFTLSCKKDKTTKTGIPELTTAEVTNILAATAMSGGNITSDGGETVVASGVCWSKTNKAPSISDDTTKSTTTSGSFSAMLKNLNPSSTYYVRAYATNRMGTGYGNLITFNTGNASPVANGITITGDAKADALLTGNYTYIDPEGDTESGTTFQWYVANSATGEGEAQIPGATAKTFRIQNTQQAKYIRFGVTPKASGGNPTGTEAKSAFIGPVGEAATVTFIYNGKEVTYGILNSATTGKKWMDRNLGATAVAASLTDAAGYGDLFQWGRLADGHQLRNSETTTILSSTDNPLNSKFIINANPGSTGDWLTTPNESLWQGVNGTNNPCPAGWRIPTQAEFAAEGFSTGADAYTKLKLTITGQRIFSSGKIENITTGLYWTSTIRPSSNTPGYTRHLEISPTTSNITNTSYTNRGNGEACRCIRD